MNALGYSCTVVAMDSASCYKCRNNQLGYVLSDRLRTAIHNMLDLSLWRKVTAKLLFRLCSNGRQQDEALEA